ncbi:YjjG family noncanonical pyrimidine nucleotidase [Candidatus Marifrigoribacter sp. Uisw_064]|uniref:YjjG family noncanonical pyrimidine nucleotidase n=1 Tax=Candidatus Marifrigoribacter sp. Uisw_064 TaxID=3230970 RepID=UPI003D412534
MYKKEITDVFFDLDHTLWDFDKNSMLAFERVLNKHNIEVNLKEFIAVYEPINFDYWKLFREDKVTKLALRRGRLIDAFSELNMKFEVSEIDQIAESYIDELPGNNHLFKGAELILTYLKERYFLHIITNGFDEVQRLKLERSGIDKYFTTVTTSDEIGVKKPNPLIFHTALKKAKTLAKSSIMIGDSFEADILGAENIGMKTILYNYRKESVPSKFNIIDDLIELKRYL